MVDEMIYLHWALCLCLTIAGILRCDELEPGANILIRYGTASTPAIAVLLALGPEIFGLTVSGWSAIFISALLFGVLGELRTVRGWLEGSPQS